MWIECQQCERVPRPRLELKKQKRDSRQTLIYSNRWNVCICHKTKAASRDHLSKEQKGRRLSVLVSRTGRDLVGWTEEGGVPGGRSTLTGSWRQTDGRMDWREGEERNILFYFSLHTDRSCVCVSLKEDLATDNQVVFFFLSLPLPFFSFSLLLLLDGTLIRCPNGESKEKNKVTSLGWVFLSRLCRDRKERQRERHRVYVCAL